MNPARRARAYREAESIADLLPSPVARAAGGRVVRPMGAERDEDESRDNTQPQVIPFIAGDAKGDLVTARGSMPKGIYDRSKRKAAQPANDAMPAPKKPGRKPRALAVVAEVAKRAPNGSKGRFDVSVDLRGGAVTINAQSGSLTLAPDEVLALFAFLGRR